MTDTKRHCPECGRKVGTHKFCPSCGTAIESGRGARDTRLSESSHTVIRGAREKTVRSEAGDETTDVGTAMSFGRYRVLREVGRGAMGVVYLARDDKIGRNVAVKALQLAPGLSEEDKKSFALRFEREAKAAGGLSHTNIVTIHDVGEEGDTPYIAMEYLEGATLTEIAAEGPLSIDQAASIVTQILSALEYAHSHDVVHRDVKPDNVFMLPDGRVKVADFGIARIASGSTMTQVGEVMGTPGYMSPEQVKGETVGPASDIFTVGVLLYELLTGTAAFGSTSATSIMYKIVHEEPKPPHLIEPGVPPYLEAVITRATAKPASQRYASAAAMKADIENARAPELPATPAAGDGTILRAGPLVMPVSPPATVGALPAPAKAPSKAKLATWGILGGVLALIIVGVVIAVLLLTGGKTSLEITSPKPDESISNAVVKVELAVKNPDKVARVDIYLDGKKQKTLDSQPFNAEITSGGAGKHELKASAYDRSGALLADATRRFSTGQGSTGQTGDYKTDVTKLINEAGSMNNQIATYANRINNEVNLNSRNVPAGLQSEVQGLYDAAQGLVTSARGLSAPQDFADIQSSFLQICDYLRIRAEALIQGLQAVGSGGSSRAAFDRGGAAKAGFDSVWPSFLTTCRSRGLGV